MTKKISTTINPIGIIILAAGASRRMGSPKQLLKIDDQTLIERTVDLTQALDHQHTVVVLGANAAKIKPFIQPNKRVSIVINKNWEQGMGTSLKAGVEFLLNQSPSLQAIIVLVCDQPYLTSEKLQELITLYQQTRAGIITTEYINIKGVPALFSKELFTILIGLNKDEGARKIIKNYKGKVATVAFAKGHIDLDTPRAYQDFLEDHLRSKKNS